MRARTPDRVGVIEHLGVRIRYEVFGDGPVTILLMPTWTIVESRFWKAQVAYLARHFRVVTYDGPGNGGSGRSLDPAVYAQDRQVAYALAVLAATGTGQAVVVALSRAANWALELAAEHPAKVHGTVLVGPAVATPGDTRPERAIDPVGPSTDPAALPPSAVPDLGTDPPTHWAKYDRDHWLTNYEDFLWFFFGQCFSEPHSTKQIEDAVGWGRQTTGEVLVAESLAGRPDRAAIEGWCDRISSPVLAVHGDEDRVRPLRISATLARRTGGDLAVMTGSGHLPMARDPVRFNLLVAEFARRFVPREPVRSTWARFHRRPRRVLYLSSPIGLGHARRDLAIARRLRELRPDAEIHWLAQDPVTRMLVDAGERVHPASALLASESAHVEGEAGEHDLHCFQALRTMDEVLVGNFMLFHDVVTEGGFDLVVGDESWEVDHFLHENPELKRYAYAWLTDFVGYLPMPAGGVREELVAADYNAEMIEHLARHPRLRDRSIFVGDPEDVVDLPFGPGLPGIREWTREHYDFSGYVTSEEPLPDREQVRAELGYAPGEQVCVVTVGGSGVGGDLLKHAAAAFDEASRHVAGLRMLVVTGPRIDPASVPARDGLEVRGYVPDLPRHLAACDLAVVQGGLSTCMELTAAGRPFVYVPLRNHFEQNVHVAHRLDRHGAGRRLDYDDVVAGGLAAVVAAEIGRPTGYRPVPGDGAARAAALLAETL